MHDKEVKLISSFLKEIETNFPSAHVEIKELTLGASTSLEYYGMLKGAINLAYKNGSIPISFEDKVTNLNEAINMFFGR